jgi:hypothetical protein
MFRVMAAFVPDTNGGCKLQAVIWNDNTAIEPSLDRSQTASTDSPENKSLTPRRCGDNFENLAAVDS